MTKNQFRKKCLKLVKNKNKTVLRDIVESNILLDKEVIGIYYPLNNEYDLLDLISLYPNKTFVFPRVIDKREMVFIKAKSVSDFTLSNFGVKEPRLDINKIVSRMKIDCFIIPCVGISKTQRLGFGAGFYDTYLEGYVGLKIGVVNKNAIDNNVILDRHDIKIDKIIVGE